MAPFAEACGKQKLQRFDRRLFRSGKESVGGIQVARLPERFVLQSTRGEFLDVGGSCGGDAAVGSVEDYDYTVGRRICGGSFTISLLKQREAIVETGSWARFFRILSERLHGEDFHLLAFKGRPIAGKISIVFSLDAEPGEFFFRAGCG